MSFIDDINKLKDRLEAYNEHEFLYLGDYLVEMTVNDLSETKNAMSTGYGEYFNEYGLITPEMGEGMHFMTGNGYSSSIPLSFEYFKIRDLMLDNLSKFTEEETLFLKNARIKLDEFESDTLPEWERQYEEYNRNPPLPAAGSGGSDSSEGDSSEPSGPAIPSPEDFWTRYGIDEEYRVLNTEISTILYNCQQACKSLKSEIRNWFDLGSDVSMTIAVAQHINGLPSQVYDKICGDHKDAVGVYSQKMKRALNTTDKIKEKYPDSNIAKQMLCLRDVVCNQLNVKEKSNEILNNLKNIFSQFGIGTRRDER